MSWYTLLCGQITELAQDEERELQTSDNHEEIQVRKKVDKDTPFFLSTLPGNSNWKSYIAGH
jgi:hypothetical protein